MPLHTTILSAIKTRAKELGRKPTDDSIFVPRKDGQLFKSFGLNAPDIHAIFKQYKKDLIVLSKNERLSLAKACMKSEYFEEQGLGITALVHGIDDLTVKDLKAIDDMSAYLRNWAITDWFAAITQPLLERHPEAMIKQLRTWNKRDHTWQQRLSVITFTRKIGESGKYTDIALELCDNVIWDKRDLVRKAVGWCLKDIMRGDKRKVIAYVKKLRRMGVSSTITLYAIRDLKGREREEILAISRRSGPSRF